MIAGDIEPLAVPRNPLDILAQQTVAAAAMHDLNADDWYATVRRAAPFAELPRDMFDAVIGMMSGEYNSEEFSAFRPRLVWNRDNGLISARPGSQKVAVTSGGTIPDRGLYTVSCLRRTPAKASVASASWMRRWSMSRVWAMSLHWVPPHGRFRTSPRPCGGDAGSRAHRTSTVLARRRFRPRLRFQPYHSPLHPRNRRRIRREAD